MDHQRITVDDGFASIGYMLQDVFHRHIWSPRRYMHTPHITTTRWSGEIDAYMTLLFYVGHYRGVELGDAITRVSDSAVVGDDSGVFSSKIVDALFSPDVVD